MTDDDTTRSARATIEAHYAANDAHDLAGMLEPLSPDIVWVEAAGFPLAGTYVGPDAVAEHVFSALQRDWQDFTAAIDELLVEGDRVVGLGSYSGTHKESGRSFTARVAHLWTVRDGKAVAFEQIADTAEVVAALP